MNLIQWAQNPWGQEVPTHIAWILLWVFAIAGLTFLFAHAIYMAFASKPSAHSNEPAPSAAVLARIPERVPRHSFGARFFHLVMAIAMIALLLTAFLPKIGFQFAWVEYHWIAGIVLTISVLYHIFHATFVLDFWSIWPDKIDIEDAGRKIDEALGKPTPAPRKSAKYPLENKLFHMIVMLAGLSVIGTGLFMMKRVETPFYTRNPYLFSDMTWGWMYVLHGLAGVGFVALVMAHIYFAIRPEKLFITKAMIFGWMARDKYLEHHDPERWPVGENASGTAPSKSTKVPA